MTVDINGYFGKVLKVKRKARRMTQHELAKKSQLDRTYISMLERGIRKPSLETAINIAKVLDVPTGEIVNEVEGLASIPEQNT